MSSKTHFLSSFISLVLVTTVVTATLPVIGQRKSAGSKTGSTASTKCTGAWTGTIAYKRTQTTTNNKTVDRVSGRGKDTTNFELVYNYKARVVVTEDPVQKGSSKSRGDVDFKLTSSETVEATEKNSCDRGKTWKDMSGTFTTRSQTEAVQKVDASAHVGMNDDGTYTVSVALPPVRGRSSGKQTSTFSGQCTPKEGKNLTMPESETGVDGNSLTSDGSHRVDPGDPNSISGSYSYTWQNVTETITWNLKKCGAPLRITDLNFADMVYPNWDEWREVNDITGTIDGNFVKIKAKVLNLSGETKSAEVMFKETYKGDKWDGAKPDQPLKDQITNVSLDPGEEKEVEILWDTSGYAWYDDGRPRLVQRVKAELWEENKKTDDMTKNLKVAPKPLVLVHGLWSNWRAWETWQNILTTSHSYDWKAFPVGEKPENGLMNTGGSFMSSQATNSIAQNAVQLKRYIDYAQRDRNAWHVDIVAHSMGGLIARDYINRLMPLNGADGRPQITKLIMLGTPNLGSPCADVMNAAFEVLGKNVEAVRQLKPSVAEEFNRHTVNRKGVKFSALSGDPLPTMCKTVEWNDGVVSVPSAVWQVADNARTKSLHTDLTGTADFSNFVRPRLAIGPRGDHNPEPPQVAARMAGKAYLNGDSSDIDLSKRFYGASSNYSVNKGLFEDIFAKSVVISAKNRNEIIVPVVRSRNFGMTFMASSDVSVTLYNNKGVEVGKNLAGSRESLGLFRSIFVDGPIESGDWKVLMENTGTVEREIVITSWFDAVK